MKYLTALILCIITLFSCNEKKSEKDYYSFFNAKINSKENILFTSIELDSIGLSNIESSYNGKITIYDDSIFFIDYLFAKVYIFNKDGILIKSKIGQGKGPGEMPIKNISAYCFLSNGEKVFIGSSLDFYLFNNNYQMIKSFYIEKNPNKKGVITPDNPNLYTFDYENFIVKSDSKGNIYLPIYAEKKDFNPCSSFEYYKKGRILAKINPKREKIIKILGRRSPEYLKYKYLGQHSFFYYDIDYNDNFYISNEIDPVIYVYDSSFNVINAFGRSGRNMDTNYKELPTMDWKKFRYLYFNDRPKRGYYTTIKYFANNDILMRSYRKGDASEYDGLQIYKKGILIADLDVPKRFEIEGFIAPFYYSKAKIDEINEHIIIYRFKLDFEK